MALLERSAREVRRIEELFRPYVSPELAVGLEEEPGLARLGGEEREVTILFADLEGFTSWAERSAPGKSIEMLNGYWAAAVPGLLDEGATIERFAGDAVMAVFNASATSRTTPSAGSEQRGRCCASEALGRAQPRLAALPRRRRHRARPRWATSGTADQRSFAAIGDTTNLAARLQAEARPGEALVAAPPRRAGSEGRGLEPRGRLTVRGRTEAVEVFALTGRAPEREERETSWGIEPVPERLRVLGGSTSASSGATSASRSSSSSPARSSSRRSRSPPRSSRSSSAASSET